VTRRAIDFLIRAAGARRAPAVHLALAILVGLAAPLHAHGPIRRVPETDAPAGTPPPPSAPLDPTAVGQPTAAPHGVTATTGVVPLHQLAAQATLVVAGVVASTDSVDDDHLRVYHLRVDATLMGTLDGTEARIVDVRGASARPSLLPDGMRAVVLLRPAPPLSYLAEHLPDTPRYALTGGRDGIVPIANDAEWKTVETTLAEAMRIGTLTDESEARRARRALAFAELASAQPRLADDALVELRRLDDVTSLTPEEAEILSRSLAGHGIGRPTRVGLIRLIGDRAWKDALPALRGADIDAPEVLDAVLAARGKLGAPAAKGELQGFLASKDPAVRSAAIRALAALPTPAVGELGRFATSDTDVGVRVAAIEALGTTRQAAAVPTLSQTFAEPRREVRQASGRALLTIGGGAASDAFVNLALHGGDADTRKYAALLLVVSTGKDSPPVQRLLASNPSGEVRDVVEHGLQWQHSHQHPGE
jgi:HEAT repeat protein